MCFVASVKSLQKKKQQNTTNKKTQTTSNLIKDSFKTYSCWIVQENQNSQFCS